MPLMALLLGFLPVQPDARDVPILSRVRLLEGGKGGGDYLAALEISLEPGYVTYWRTPGEAGIPPAFDWSSSKNVADVSVSWPAPERIREADSIVYGFRERVILPLRITPKEPGGAVDLRLAMQYGICKDICIPVESSATLNMRGVGDNALAIQRAIRNLPRETPVGSEEPLSVLSMTGMEDKSEALVTVRVPVGEKAELFAEGPEGWLYSTSEGRPGSQPGTMEFTVKLEASPPKRNIPAPIRLTLRAGMQSIETTVSLNP